jgi:hypothetical protein
VSVSTVDRAIRGGALQAVHAGGVVRIRSEWVDLWLERRGTAAARVSRAFFPPVGAAEAARMLTAIVDAETLEFLRQRVAAEAGVAQHARRLRGQSLGELRRDAQRLRVEVGLDPDPRERERDGRGGSRDRRAAAST